MAEGTFFALPMPSRGVSLEEHLENVRNQCVLDFNAARTFIDHRVEFGLASWFSAGLAVGAIVTAVIAYYVARRYRHPIYIVAASPEDR
jgi:hypothetical protein